MVYDVMTVFFGLSPASNSLMKHNVSEDSSASIFGHFKWWIPYTDLLSVTRHHMHLRPYLVYG